MAPFAKSGRWRGFRSVLCPVDFSEQSRAALRYADAIARRAHGTLTVTYANDPFLIAGAAAALHDRDIARRSLDELETFIHATLAEGPKTRRRLTWRVSVGDPLDQVLKAAARERSDLIVLGTHGLTGADRLLLGSTTLGVLQRSTIPVLAIPRHASDSGARLSPSWPGRRLIAAIELDRATPREIMVAGQIAKWFDSSLLLTHVVGELPAPSWLKDDLAADDRARFLRAQQRIEALVERLHLPVATEARVVSGRPSDEVAELASAERIGLVITALRDRRGWFGANRGSVSYAVLSHAVTPVLACPPEWRPR